MKKIVCASCGMVNLEKFTTFPFCAACGVRLPDNSPSKARAFWTQPVRPLIFASSIGLGVAVLGLGAVTVARETRDRSDQMLVVYSQIPRKVSPNGLIYTAFILDTTADVPSPSFERAQLRVPDELFRQVKLQTISPPPSLTFQRQSGHYFEWDRLERNTPIQLSLKPLKSGTLRFPVALFARGFQMFQVRLSVQVKPSDISSGIVPN